MASTISGASLANIYNRLNNAPTYHPLEAKTFSDWAVEAGDILTINRGDNNEESYQSPVLTSRMVWRGTPQMTLNSSGSKEREAVSRVSRRKYGRGGGYMNDRRFAKEFLDAYEGLYSFIEVTSSRMYTTFVGMYDGLSSEFEVTRSRMYVDFSGLYDGLSSEFELTRSRMYVDFSGLYDGLSSQFELTRSRMYVDFSGLYDGLSSEFELTRSRMYVDFSGLYDGLSSQFELTRSRMYVDFDGLYDGLSASFEVTRSRMYVDFDGLYDGLSSEFETTRSRLYYQVSNYYTNLRSRIVAESDRIGLVVEGTGDNAHIKAAQIVASINDSGSETLISANKILLDGNTTVAGMLRVEDGDLFVNGGLALASGKEVSASYYRIGTAIRFPGPSSATQDIYFGRSDVENMIVDALADGNTLKLWKRGDAADSPSITFSKATSLSGAWSGNKLTVTASPQNVKYETYVGTDIGQFQGETGYFMYPNYWTPTATTPVAITDAKKQLTIADSSDDVVRLMKDGTSTGLVYYHGKYTAGVSAGRKSVTPSISWPVGWTVTASNPYDNTKTASIEISMSHGSDSTGHYIELHSNETSSPLKAKKTISLNTGSVSSGSRTVKVNFDGSDILSATISDYSNGQSAAGISTSWGTGSGANVLTVERALSSDTKSATFTVTAGAPTGSYNSSTHKYVLTGTALVNNTQRATGSGGTGTEAYDDGVSAGKSAAGISTSWGTGSGANVLTVERALSSSTKSATFTVTAGNPTYSYNSSTHKYALTGTALVNSTQKASGVSSTGTEAYDAGVSAGKSAAGIITSWGTGSGANVLTVERALSSSTKSATFTVTAGNPTYSYNSSTHKYALTGTALVNNTQRASGVSSTGTEAYDAGVGDCNFIDPNFNLRYGDMYSGTIYTSGSSGTYVRDVTGTASTGIRIPLSENGANALSDNLTEIPAGGIIQNGNYKFMTGKAGIRYLNVAVPVGVASNIDLNSPEWMWDSAWTSLPSSDARRSAIELTTIKNLIRDNHGQGRAGWLLFRATYNGGTGAKWYRINTQWA